MKISKACANSGMDFMPHAPLVFEAPASICAVCGGDIRMGKLLATGQDYEYETCRNIWGVWVCGTCGHGQLDPRPADSELSIIYPSNYYSYDMQTSVNGFALWCKSILDSWKLRSILSFARKVPETFLDVGCGDGRYLKYMMKIGLAFERVHGLEIDASAVKRASARGLNVRCARVEDAHHLDDQGLDLITMFHVIEHLAQPQEIVRILVNKLKPGGLLVVETPNINSLDVRIFGRQFWGGYHFPRHWHIFSASSVTHLLKGSGLNVEVIKYQTGHAFWLFSAHNYLKYKLKLPVVARYVHPLHNIVALSIVVVFDAIRSALGFSTSAMLVIARKPELKE